MSQSLLEPCIIDVILSTPLSGDLNDDDQRTDFQKIRQYLMSKCGEDVGKKKLLQQAILIYFVRGNSISKMLDPTKTKASAIKMIDEIVKTFGVVDNAKGIKYEEAPYAITMSRIAAAFAPEACNIICQLHKKLFRIVEPSILTNLLKLSVTWPTIIMWQSQCCIIPNEENPKTIAVFKALVFLNAVYSRTFRGKSLILDSTDYSRSIKFCSMAFRSNVINYDQRYPSFNKMIEGIDDVFFTDINNHPELADIQFPAAAL